MVLDALGLREAPAPELVLDLAWIFGPGIKFRV